MCQEFSSQSLLEDKAFRSFFSPDTPDSDAINLESLRSSLNRLSPPCELECVCFCLIRIYGDYIIIMAY